MLYTWNYNVSLHVNYISILKILLESIYKHKSLETRYETSSHHRRDYTVCPQATSFESHPIKVEKDQSWIA